MGIRGPQAQPGGRGFASRRSVRGKLIALVVCSVGVAVTLVAGVSAWREGERDAAQQVERLRTTATVMSSLSAEAAAAGDRGRAFRALRSIALMPHVLAARIERPDGRPLVQTGGGASLVGDLALDVDARVRPGLTAELHSRTVQVSAPILYDGRDVGRLVLLSRTEGVLGRLLASLGASLVAALVAVAVGLVVAWRMQRAITRPIVALTRSMDEIQHGGGFDREVQAQADDEIGDLVQGFNRMAAEIRTRDAAIAAHLTGLEGEVAARTADLNVAKDVAEHANRAKSDFLATMSHEIRTPMNGIMVMAEMLAAGEIAPRQRRFAQVIAKSGSSLLAIINDILDFSKIEAGKMELESAPVDLAEAVEDVCALFWERAAAKGLDLAAYIDPATPRLISADAVRLRQVVGNLINNAIKFTEQGGVLIEVEPDAGSVRISVHDTGVGIPKDKIGTVFGAFSQADQSTTRKFGGTGLGLAICKRLVEAMGGRFQVSSEPGRGSTFAFRLPVQVLEPAAPWPDAGAGGQRTHLAVRGLSSRRALSRYLGRAGLSVASAAGDRAVLRIGDAPSLQLQAPNVTPTVCLGSYGESAPYELQRAGAVQAVLVQPFRRTDLEALLRQLAEGRPLTDPQTAACDADEDQLPDFGGARVLVADDSAVNREVAMEALSRLGVEVRLVNDGAEAVEAALSEAFDLVLMDGSMPVMDGYAAALEIRRLQTERVRARTPIVALTAHVVGDAAEAWRDAQMDAVLHKPFTLAGLARVLGDYLVAHAPTPRPALASPQPAVVASSALLSSADALIDPDVAAQLAGMASAGRGEFVARIYGLYRDNAPAALEQLAAAAGQGDPAAAAKAAHALKSMSFNVGAKAVAAAAGAMEAAARDGVTPAPAQVSHLLDLLAATLVRLGAGAASSAFAAPAVARPGPPAIPAAEAELLRDLERGLAEDQLTLVYQPQVDRDGEKIVGVETLLRWTHPTRGVISPAVFIPLAETHGAISQVTSWVVDRMLAETRYLKELQVAFNASAIEFAEPGFVDRLIELIARHGYDPRRLEIEITETAILQNEAAVRQTIERLRALGMKVALDDFGAGYSSLGHLRRYPFDKLKIDREFITDCSRDMQAATIVHAVVSIGRALGMKVIAEGVETETQRKFLRVAGVHAMQGYLFGKAVSIDELTGMLATTPRLERA